MQPLPMPDSGLNLPLKEESENFEAKLTSKGARTNATGKKTIHV